MRQDTPIPLGVANSNLSLTSMLAEGLYPLPVLLPRRTNHKLPAELWPDLLVHSETRTLRELASRYHVSHESVRRALKALTQ